MFRQGAARVQGSVELGSPRALASLSRSFARVFGGRIAMPEVNKVRMRRIRALSLYLPSQHGEHEASAIGPGLPDMRERSRRLTAAESCRGSSGEWVAKGGHGSSPGDGSKARARITPPKAVPAMSAKRVCARSTESEARHCVSCVRVLPRRRREECLRAGESRCERARHGRSAAG